METGEKNSSSILNTEETVSVYQSTRHHMSDIHEHAVLRPVTSPARITCFERAALFTCIAEKCVSLYIILLLYYIILYYIILYYIILYYNNII